MSSIDLFVIIIIILFSLIGFYRGLLKSVFGLISIVLSIALSIVLYPVVVALLKPVAYEPFDKVISKNLDENFPELSKEKVSSKVVEELGFPEYLEKVIIKAMPDPNELIPKEKIISIISDKLTNILLIIMSVIIIFIIVKLIFIFIRKIIKKVTEHKVIGKVDKLGGILFGLFEGFILIHFIFAVLTLFFSAGLFESLNNSINSSDFIAKSIYENNIILSLISLDK
jgi:uncharacterized membrane protein required for colicin V production